MESPGQWLEKTLLDLCEKPDTGLTLEKDIISSLVSYCEFAEPVDAKEYLDNIIGLEAGEGVINEYLQRRGHSNLCTSKTADVPSSKFHAYVKPPAEVPSSVGTKKGPKTLKETGPSNTWGKQVASATNESKTMTQGNSRKKKAGKVVSLAEAAKGSIVFHQGKPCSCQARQHRLVSNCLSCGKIVCEQEGEGPCSFCGSLVLREGSKYAGLDETMPIISEAEAAAEAYAKRLVDYDRNSAARTTVIDDQSDYYEIEGNSWLSMEEKELLRKKREEIEEAERAKRNKVIVTFDLVGRKVLINEDEASELQSQSTILRPPDEKEVNRIKPNPTAKVHPIFIDFGPKKKAVTGKASSTSRTLPSGLCLEITGRVQYEAKGLKQYIMDSQLETVPSEGSWHEPMANMHSHASDDNECSLDYN